MKKIFFMVVMALFGGFIFSSDKNHKTTNEKQYVYLAYFQLPKKFSSPNELHIDSRLLTIDPHVIYKHLQSERSPLMFENICYYRVPIDRIKGCAAHYMEYEIKEKFDWNIYKETKALTEQQKEGIVLMGAALCVLDRPVQEKTEFLFKSIKQIVADTFNVLNVSDLSVRTWTTGKKIKTPSKSISF